MIPQFAGELVKRSGDGVIAMFGLEGKASKHADRAAYPLFLYHTVNAMD